jgi:hypothetical protein
MVEEADTGNAASKVLGFDNSINPSMVKVAGIYSENFCRMTV